jgi:hypothetical protein
MKPRYLLLCLILFLVYNSLFSQSPSQLFQKALLKGNGEVDLKTAVAL